MHQNPYESPQTIGLAAPRGDDHAQDTSDVIRGSQTLLISAIIHVAILLAEIVSWFIQVDQNWILLRWSLLAVAMVSALFKIRGLWLMLRVPRSSRAKGYLKLSLASFVLSILLYWIFFGLSYLWDDYRWMLGGYYLCLIFGWFDHLFLQWSLRRIGQHYAISRLSHFALIGFFYQFSYHGIGLTRTSWMFLNDPWQEFYVHLAKKSLLMADPIHALCTLSYWLFFIVTLQTFKQIVPQVDEDHLFGQTPL